MPTPLSRLGLLVRTNTPVEPELVGVFLERSPSSRAIYIALLFSYEGSLLTSFRAAFTPASEVEMVGVLGFEPRTLCSQSRCATRLRYTPIIKLYGEDRSQYASCRLVTLIAQTLTNRKIGWIAWIRTKDILVNSEALYHWSYYPIFC